MDGKSALHLGRKRRGVEQTLAPAATRRFGKRPGLAKSAFMHCLYADIQRVRDKPDVYTH
jgi:hypothetical protein